MIFFQRARFHSCIVLRQRFAACDYPYQQRCVTTASSPVENTKKTRNVGIMAHIDAGKTTTTERMLYYSGRISFPGEVHHGDTVTDFLPQERERGITIQSAVVGFNWNESQINIIDTPGHVDFTFEVERALRVVDSAVAILDASAGVEAQTLTVWRQAADYRLPRLIFLNKMDKSSASYQLCLESIRSKLKVTPVLLQSPVYSSIKTGSGSGLVGLIDLITLQRFVFNHGKKGAQYFTEDVSNTKELVRDRCDLVEQVADLDNTLATRVIECESIEAITVEEINAAVKRITVSNTGVPVLLGSAYKNVGVQPLLDSIIKFLPEHSEVIRRKDDVILAYGKDLCAFAFKTIHDRQLGPLTFMRIFAGSLESGHKIYNVTRQNSEKVLKTYLPFADEYKEVSELMVGQVGVVSGLKETVTGDTLTSSAAIASTVGRKYKLNEAAGETRSGCLSGVSIPEPVFFCAVEPASLHQQKGLDLALECLKREDPSLRVHVDSDTSQTIMSGMGELHLEVIHERLKTDFKVDCDLGKVMVAYKETITAPVLNRITFERKLADRDHSVVIELEVQPKSESALSTSTTCSLLVRKGHGREVQELLQGLTERQLRHVTNGVEAGLRMGPKLGFPVILVDVLLNYFVVGRGTSETIIEAAAAHCVRQALRNANVSLLEPVVALEVTVDERFQHIITEDLNRRRFCLESIDLRHGNKVVTGTAPLSELLGYSTDLRTISSGLGTYSMQFSHHKRVANVLEEEKIMKSVRGF